MTIIGLDIGGSKIEAILWKNGRILSAEKIKTPKNKRVFFVALERLIGSIKTIGVAVAGAMDYKRGTILNSPNLKFLNGVKLVEILRKKFRRPVKMDNDTNCFLLAETRFGQAQGKKNVVALTLGTGVGGAVMVDGKLMRGHHGAAGELGHMVIDTPYSIEDLVSSHGFARLGITNPLYLQKKAFEGDKKARAIYVKLGQYLGIALANLINIFDPEMIILGGGISKAARLFMPQAMKEMKKHTLLPERLFPPVKISKLKHAGALGAVALFLE